MAAALEDAVGTVCWWGLSPAIDLRLHLPPGPEASVLLVGAAEGRHLLMTAARARRGPPRDITVRTGTPGGTPVPVPGSVSRCRAPGRGEAPGSGLSRCYRGSPGATGALPVLPGLSRSSSWPSRAPSPWLASSCSCCWRWKHRSGPEPQVPAPPVTPVSPR
ncbi:dynein assembly factor 3, axonemal isoform X2 [Pyrgilauda ruficollis]|uniref:dynein assembly factor 3, axonemal isoform X2 n=1 Tax=Pyrgilauda ruficollis TaxID=221976 RepID=UPI001B87CC6D|nr:dynein assembly factor 3, axonemal isoform X2 [Pyrgilauda ruficollis]